MASMELAALRLVKVPDAAPPYDCETHGANCPALRDLAGSGVPGVPGAADPASLRDLAGFPGSAGAASSVDAPGPAGTAATTAWPRQFAQVMVEILAGTRPVRQVAPWATDHALAQIRGLLPGFTSDRRPRIQRVVTSWPAASAVEVTVVAVFGPRTRALAMRFEQIAARQAAPGLPPRPARWLCTAVEAG